MKIRIKFRKSGVMKFIGHLDIMRYFQKAMRRADIDICYSEGFSPHQIMSFAAPLGVGITSDGEYLDIEVHESKSTKEAMADLNATMVEGVEITGYVKLPDNAKTAMSLVAAADYKLFFKEGYEVPFTKTEAKQAILDYFITPSEVLITKQTKKSEKIMDLKSLKKSLRVRLILTFCRQALSSALHFFHGPDGKPFQPGRNGSHGYIRAGSREPHDPVLP